MLYFEIEACDSLGIGAVFIDGGIGAELTDAGTGAIFGMGLGH